MRGFGELVILFSFLKNKKDKKNKNKSKNFHTHVLSLLYFFYFFFSNSFSHFILNILVFQTWYICKF